MRKLLDVLHLNLDCAHNALIYQGVEENIESTGRAGGHTRQTLGAPPAADVKIISAK